MNNKEIVVRCRAVIITDGKLLTVRNTNNDFLSLPGGHLEFGEDPEECIVREVIEELGITPNIGRILYINTYVDTNAKQSIEFFFEITNPAEYLGLEEAHRSHAHEVEEYVWLSPADEAVIMPVAFDRAFKEGVLNSGDTVFLKG